MLLISKAILAIVGQDIIDAAGPLQLCIGFDGGCEIAVHSIRHLFANSETEAILLVDATNAFNTLNRDTALHNILDLCPSLGRVLVNTYRQNVNLFVDGETIVSREGYSRGPTSNGNVITGLVLPHYLCLRYLPLNRYDMLTIQPPVVPLRACFH